MIRTLVVDDEQIARQGLRHLLADEPDFDVVGESANGRDAVDQIRTLAPQLVFLDVQMPDLDGFGVLDAVAPADLPIVVFVTAYDRYALDAFEASAVDYLLKPFDRPRLRHALERVRRFIGAAEVPSPPLAEAAATLPAARRIVVKDRSGVTHLAPDDIAWVQSDGNYLHIGTRTKVYLTRDTLHRLEERLDPARFIRASRSVIVNVNEVRRLRRAGEGRYRIVMHSGHQLVSSRRYRVRLLPLLGAG